MQTFEAAHGNEDTFRETLRIKRSVATHLLKHCLHISLTLSCRLQTFEAAHGNEDTFREMLRIKRSVAASYSQTHYNSVLSEAAMAATTPGKLAADESSLAQSKSAPEPGACTCMHLLTCAGGVQLQSHVLVLCFV